MIPFLAGLCAAILFSVSTQAGTWWPLAWIAPLPVLWYALGSGRTRNVAIVSFSSFLFGELSLVPLYYNLIPLLVFALFLALPAAGFAASILIFRRAVRGLPAAAAILIFPATWTAWEYLFSLVSPNGTGLSIGYSQMTFLPLIQIASVTGLWGITFLLCLVPAGLALALRLKGRRQVFLMVPLASLVVGLGFGFMRLRDADRESPIRVGLATSDANRMGFGTRDPNVALKLVGAYVPRIDKLAAQGAKVVVLPEMLATLRPAWAGKAQETLARAAGQNGVLIVAGFDEWAASGAHRNIADVFSPEGRMVAEYVKEHHIPGQDFTIGQDLVILPGHMGVAICKDMDFQQLGLRYARAGASLLLVPAWDFGKDGWMHAQMAQLRTVEGGFAMLRSAEEGWLTVIDSRGRVIRKAVSSDGPEVLLVAEVAPGRGSTVYSRIGDVFGQSCVVLALGLMIAGFVRKGHN